MYYLENFCNSRRPIAIDNLVWWWCCHQSPHLRTPNPRFNTGFTTLLFI
jgi:hypothetical protein